MKTSPINFIYQSYIDFMTINNNHISSLYVCIQSPFPLKLLLNTFNNTYSEILLLLLWSKIQKLIIYSYSQPGGSAGKESACNVGDLGSIPGLGRYPEGKGYPLQYSGLENFMGYSSWG